MYTNVCDANKEYIFSWGEISGKLVSNLKRNTVEKTSNSGISNEGAWPTFGLLGWPWFWPDGLSAAPNMLLLCPPGGCFCCRAGGSGSPNIPLLFPPTYDQDKCQVLQQ